MPAKRSFSYEYLWQLVREHPDWSHQEYADALTAEVRERTGDPNYPRVKPNTVAAALSRYRGTLAEEGLHVAPRHGTGRILPWIGIPQGYRMDTRLRHMRVLAQLDAGNEVEPRQARLAQKFARGLQEQKRVIDLTGGGRPIVRAARPYEVDGEGNLLNLYARWPGLTDDQWTSMSPAERTSASKWL